MLTHNESTDDVASATAAAAANDVSVEINGERKKKVAYSAERKSADF